jgi:hypothetical protein
MKTGGSEDSAREVRARYGMDAFIGREAVPVEGGIDCKQLRPPVKALVSAQRPWAGPAANAPTVDMTTFMRRTHDLSFSRVDHER